MIECFRRVRRPVVVWSITLALCVAIASAQPSGQGPFAVPWHTIDAGGGTSHGGAFTLSGTVGQPDASGTMSGGGFTVSGGFWHGGALVDPCFGDFNTDGAITSLDLLSLLGAWGECPGCPQDLDDDGAVTSLDLLALLGAWGPC